MTQDEQCQEVMDCLADMFPDGSDATHPIAVMTRVMAAMICMAPSEELRAEFVAMVARYLVHNCKADSMTILRALLAQVAETPDVVGHA